MRFTGQGPVRTIYFAILISHTILRRDRPAARPADPLPRAAASGRTAPAASRGGPSRIWLYVSVTGRHRVTSCSTGFTIRTGPVRCRRMMPFRPDRARRRALAAVLRAGVRLPRARSARMPRPTPTTHGRHGLAAHWLLLLDPSLMVSAACGGRQAHLPDLASTAPPGARLRRLNPLPRPLALSSCPTRAERSPEAARGPSAPRPLRSLAAPRRSRPNWTALLSLRGRGRRRGVFFERPDTERALPVVDRPLRARPAFRVVPWRSRFYPASVIKAFFLAYYESRKEAGKVKDTPELVRAVRT